MGLSTSFIWFSTLNEILVVEKSSFIGKEFQISATFFNEKWTLFAKNSFKVGCELFVSFKEEDLIKFDSNCENYFTQPIDIK